MPVSATSKRSVTASAAGSCRRTRSAIVPRSVNLIAFDSRLASTCRSRRASPTSASGTSAATSLVISTAFPPRRGASDFTRLSSRPRRRNGFCSLTSLPASIFEKSRMSLMTSSRASADSRMASRWPLCAGVRPVSPSSSAVPITALSGVRISWLTLARKVLLARLARSAASRASRSSAACRRRSSSARLSAVTSVWQPSRRIGSPRSLRIASPRQRTHTVPPSRWRYRTIWSYGWFGSARCLAKLSRATSRSSGKMWACHHSDVLGISSSR